MSKAGFLVTLFATSLLILPVAAIAAITSKSPADVAAGHYDVDPTHTSIQARIDHLGFSTTTVAFEHLYRKSMD